MKAKTRSCVVSLIGRPNVGKSTIFNRIIRSNFKAMTHDLAGVTRDRHYSIASMESPTGEDVKDIIIVDTGGFYPEKVEEVTVLGKKKTAEPFFNRMAEHAKLTIDESDLVLMVVDVREGLIPFDKTIADYIRTAQKPIWLLVNKFDTDKQWGDEAEFYSLGLTDDNFFIVSAEHGRGLQTLRDSLYKFAEVFEPNQEIDIQKGVTPNYDVVANVAIIGAPNAGKSTLLNQFLGANRALISDVAGTTVDPIEGYFDLYFGKDTEYLTVQKDQYRTSDADLLEEMSEYTDEFAPEELLAYNEMPESLKFSTDDIESEEDMIDEELNNSIDTGSDMFGVEDLDVSLQSEEDEHNDETIEEDNKEELNPYRSVKLVDTAGIRRQKVVAGFIEEQSVYRSLRAITEADVVIFMVDATLGISHQDRRLCDIAIEKGKSIIICLNKIDLLKDIFNDSTKKKEWLLDLRAKIPWLSFCELITISAKNGKYLKSLKDSIRKTVIIRNQKVTTGKLNKTLTALVDRYPVVLDKGSNTVLRVKYASMIKSTPPTFLLFTNKSKSIPPNYRKYLTNGLRTEFKMVNTPIHLIFRTTTDIEKRMKRARVNKN